MQEYLATRSQAPSPSSEMNEQPARPDQIEAAIDEELELPPQASSPETSMPKSTVPADSVEKSKDTTPAVEPHLDEIHVAGSVRLIKLRDTMRARGYHCLAEYIDVIASERVPDWMKKIVQTKRPPNVKKRFHAHLAQLARWNVVAASATRPHGKGGSKAESQFTSTYFEVPKSASETRAIFNGKALSEASPTPPPVNLADTRRFVERLKKYLCHRRKDGKLNKVHIWMGDFRHWFHQLGMHPSRWKWFSVKCEEHLSYLWRVLPMGWSWSPAIAQAVAWSVLIAHTDAEKFLNLTPFKDRTARLPTFIETREGGFITVYYDNFFVISPTEAERDGIAAMCSKNFHDFGAVVKESAMRTVNHADFMSPGGFEYLGIHARGVSKGSSIILELRPAKLKKWLPPAESLSTRDAAIIVGRAVFCGLLHGNVFLKDPLGRNTIKLARRVGIHASLFGWSSKWSDISAVQALWSSIYNLIDHPVKHNIGQIERAEKSKTEQKHYILATDASLDGEGFCLYRLLPDSNELRLIDSAAFRTNLSFDAKIFDYEMEAVLRSLTRPEIRSLVHDPDVRVTLVVDNSGVAHSIRNGLTESDRGQEMIDAMYDEIARVDTVLVISNDNPADVPSRTYKVRKTDDPTAEMEARAQRMLLAVQAYERGWCWGSLPLTQWIAHECGIDGIRHSPGLDKHRGEVAPETT